MNSFYIIIINCLSDIWFANILLPFCRFSFHFVDGFFYCGELTTINLVAIHHLIKLLQYYWLYYQCCTYLLLHNMYFTIGSMYNLIPVATPYTNFVSRVYIWIERRVHFPTEHLTYIHCPLLISLYSILWFLLSICQPEHLVSATSISPYGDWYVGIIFIFNDKAK